MAKKEISILFENTTLEVSDPYTKHQPVVIEGCLPGRWQQVLITADFGPFGERNNLLILEHEDLENLCSKCADAGAEWVHLGEFGVDCGTAAIYDPELSDDEIYGIQCDSGMGDGCYPVHVMKNNDGKVIAIRVDFDIYGFTDQPDEAKVSDEPEST